MTLEQAIEVITNLADNVQLNKAQRDVVYGAIETIRSYVEANNADREG